MTRFQQAELKRHIMKLTRSVVPVAAFCILSATVTYAQDRTQDNTTASRPIPTKNPLEGNADAIRIGQGIFRSRCADCHGMDARGMRAPDLTQVWASGRTDDGLYGTLRNGVAGTEMPSVGARTPDDEVW